jgi:hypothetical protein
LGRSIAFVIATAALEQQIVHRQKIFDDLMSRTKITSISNFKPPSFLIHHGKATFLVATDPVCHFLSFQCFQSTLLHQGRLSRRRSIEKEANLMEKLLRRIKISK